MKRIGLMGLLVVLIFTSCIGQGKQAAVASPTATRSTDTTSSTSTPRLTRTPRDTWTPWNTSTPPHTRIAPSSTATIAPTFLSTLDTKSTAAKTQSGVQTCPKVNPALKPDFPHDASVVIGNRIQFYLYILDFLNAGGKPELLQSYLGLRPTEWTVVDLTGDGIAEIVSAVNGVVFLMCQAGYYSLVQEIMLRDIGDFASILASRDMNMDGVRELIIDGVLISASADHYRILEWDGTEFQNLIWSEKQLLSWSGTPTGRAMNWYKYPPGDYPSEEQYIIGFASTASIQDTNGDGKLELVIKNELPKPSVLDVGPFRKTTETYQWNGKYFGLTQVAIDPPAYRFQAVQEGDRLSLLGEYGQAQGFYQQVISNKNLLAWSQDNYQDRLFAYPGTPTPTLVPLNQDEYDNQAAYAAYRILLLRLLQHQPAEAQTVYDNLEKTYPQGKAGYIYAELASSFWEEYQASQNMAKACAQAIQYADEHKDSIYTYLGNVKNKADSFGVQSHFYASWDLCPFE